MSRLSFRPRPLDIHKKLPIVKSIKEFEDDDVPTATSTRNSQLQRIAAEAENEVQHTYTRKSTQEIPIPQFNVVDTYERDYSRTFNQPNSYVRGRGARAELGEFVEYDLDNEDEDWLHEFNNEKKALSSEKLELLLFKLEVLDHKARERAGIITPTLIGPIPAILQFDSASEALHSLSIRSAILQSVYNYWRRKRERWQKPVLRRLQPPPPVNDTNPYNVFRPREKAHKLHTRRMQRRENNVQSFEKLRQVRRNLDQAKTIVGALIKREEKKRELTETEVKFQQYRMKHKHEAQFVDDGIALPGFSAAYCKFGSSEDDLMDSDDGTNFHPRPYGRFATTRNPSYMDSKLTMVPRGNMKRILKREHLTPAWLPRKDPHEPILLFTKPLDLEKLAVAGIVPPSDPPIENGTMLPIENGIKAQYRFHGRIGRGGRIIFDRCNPMLRAPTGPDISSYSPVLRSLHRMVDRR